MTDSLVGASLRLIDHQAAIDPLSTQRVSTYLIPLTVLLFLKEFVICLFSSPVVSLPSIDKF